MSFDSLPVEILVKTLSFLDISDLFTARALNQFCNDVITNSSLLQYLITLQTSGCEDEPSPLHIRRKLAWLTMEEHTWRVFDLSKRVRVRIMHQPSNIYDLSGGIYMLGDSQTETFPRITKSLRYIDLTACTRGPPARSKAWAHLDIGVDIVDVGLALQEHDLLAAITREWPDHQPWSNEINRLHLKQFSTGANHPSASTPVITVDECPNEFGRISVMIEVVGPLLLLLLTRPFSDSAADRLFLFNWMTGELLIKEQASEGTWSGFVFLSPDTVALPNLQTRSLEILGLHHPQRRIDHPRTHFHRVRVLALPSVLPFHYFSHISCRADPNPFGCTQDEGSGPAAQEEGHMHGQRARGRVQARPFGAAPECAVVLFQCYMGDLRNRLLGQWAARPVCFSFIVHRSTLLRVAHMHGLGVVGGDAIADGHAGTVPWDAWGPAGTRWEGLDEDASRWVTTTAGQREVLLRNGHIVVRDYNPYAVRRARAALAAADAASAPQPRFAVMAEPSETPHSGYFAADITSSLSYVEVVSEKAYLYDGVLMDEERIIALSTDEESGAVAYLDIFTLSPAMQDVP